MVEDQKDLPWAPTGITDTRAGRYLRCRYPEGPGSYVANGSEHDGMGDTTHRPERHIQMTTRRFSKLELLKDGTYESENTSAPV